MFTSNREEKRQQAIGSESFSTSILSVELLAIACVFLFTQILFKEIRYSSQVALVISLAVITWMRKSRNRDWKELGFRLPDKWPIAILYFVLCVLTIGLTFNFIVQPLFPQGANSIAGGAAVSLSEMLFQVLVIGIGSAAIGEELLFRGYLFNTLDQLLGENWIGTTLSLLLQAIIFAILHRGIQGMVSAGVIGLILGVFYLLSNRNLMVVMAAHAVPDILSIIGSYQNQ